MARDRPSPYGERGSFWHSAGQALALREKRRMERSAGACPPRSLNRSEKRPQPKKPWTFAVTTGARRGTGPRPTVNGDDFLFITVARGPVPRDLSISAKNARNPRSHGPAIARGCHRDVERFRKHPQLRQIKNGKIRIFLPKTLSKN